MARSQATSYRADFCVADVTYAPTHTALTHHPMFVRGEVSIEKLSNVFS